MIAQHLIEHSISIVGPVAGERRKEKEMPMDSRLHRRLLHRRHRHCPKKGVNR